MLKYVLVALLLVPAPLFAQGGPLAGENPLAELKEQVTRVLSAAKLPFTDEQEQAITLMMEDRRKASEELFGDLLDFAAGPTQGQDEDRLRSAIGWMRNEFLAQLQNFLTPEQNIVWTRFLETPIQVAEAEQSRDRQQTQYVRINNNAFTAEDDRVRTWRRRARDRDHSAGRRRRVPWQCRAHGQGRSVERQKPVRVEQAPVPGTRDQLRLRRAGHPRPADVNALLQPQQGRERRYDPCDDPRGPLRSGNRPADDHQGGQHGGDVSALRFALADLRCRRRNRVAEE